MRVPRGRPRRTSRRHLVSTTYLGHIFHVAGSPTVADAREHLVSLPDGALVVSDAGTIEWIGAARDLPPTFAGASVVDNRGGYIVPGFVDAHMHFPQTYSTDSYGGGQLLEWLDNCIFPAESRLADPAFAEGIARDFTRRRVAVGTTAAMVFGSAFPHAQDALFRSTREAGLRVVSGRGIQTVGPESASALLTGEAEALALVRDEIDRWHAVDTGDATTARIQVAIVPRFSLSVRRETLRALGELYDAVRGSGVYFHSHLSENDSIIGREIAAVKAVYETTSDLDTYDGRFMPGSKEGGSSLLGRRSIFAHGVHCTDDELARLAETGSSIAHCPTSQQFLGSGTMPWKRTTGSGVTVALGSDVGAGDEWLISRVMNDAFKVHISEPLEASVSLHPAELLFTGTLAGARALDMEERFGNLDVGKDADFLLIDPERWEPLAMLLEGRVRSDDERVDADRELFALLMGLREAAIAGVYVQGTRVVAPE